MLLLIFVLFIKIAVAAAVAVAVAVVAYTPLPFDSSIKSNFFVGVADTIRLFVQKEETKQGKIGKIEKKKTYNIFN